MKRKSPIVAIGLLVAAAGVVHAEHAPVLDRVAFSIGATYADTDNMLSLHADNGADRLPLDLGGSTRAVPRLRLDALLFDSQGISLDYFTFNRNRTLASIDGPIEIDDDVYDRLSLDTKYELDVGSATWRWWFGHDTDVFGIGVGAAYYRARLDLVGTALAHSGESGSTNLYRWSDKAAAPVVTLSYRHAFSDAWRFYAGAYGLKRNGGKLAGHVYDFHAGVEWFPWENFGFAAQYGRTDLSIRRNRSDGTGFTFDTDFTGPTLYFRTRF